jgi:hypothetical protein
MLLKKDQFKPGCRTKPQYLTNTVKFFYKLIFQLLLLQSMINYNVTKYKLLF